MITYLKLFNFTGNRTCRILLRKKTPDIGSQEAIDVSSNDPIRLFWISAIAHWMLPNTNKYYLNTKIL